MPAFGVERHEALFVEAVNSIINQTYTKWELIIVCDGNFPITINCIAKIIGKLKDKRIKFYRSKRQNGPGIARNLAVDVAKGTYLTFHDTDDYSEPDRFEKLMSAIDSSGIIASSVMVNTIRLDSGVRIEEKRYMNYSGKALDRLIQERKVRVPIHLPSAIISTELFRFMGGFEKYKYSSDALLAIKIAYYREMMDIGPIPLIHEPLFNWNRHSNSVTTLGENAYTFKKCQTAQRKPLIRVFREQYLRGEIKKGAPKKDVKRYLGIINNLAGQEKLQELNIKY